MVSRRVLFAIAALAALPTIQPAMAADSAERVVMHYLAAWNMHDVQQAANALAYDVTYYEPRAGKVFAGRDAARLGMQGNFLAAVPDGIWMLRGNRVVAGNSIALEWEIAGNNTGMWSDGTAPTGKHVVLHGMSLFQVNDGKIVYQADYYNRGG